MNSNRLYNGDGIEPAITGNGALGVHLGDGDFAGFRSANITGGLDVRSAISDHSLYRPYRRYYKLR